MPIEGLDRLSARGQQLLRGTHAVGTHDAFESWVSEVSEWLVSNYPDSGLSAEWNALSTSNLIIGGAYYNDPTTWIYFRSSVQTRLRWLGGLPETVTVRKLDMLAQAQEESEAVGWREIKSIAVAHAYVDPDRISELKSLSAKHQDLSRLIRLCEELNVCFAGECYLAMILLTRSIIDHVPPIFSCKNFGEVANNYPSSRSFKELMSQLDSTSRKIADHYLHAQIRKPETLPNAVQVNFSNALDSLLAEIAAVLK